MSYLTLVLCVPLIAGGLASAQTPETPNADLFRTIEKLDTALFDAYNRCELDKFSALLADDVEFYHDQAGLMIGSRAVTEAVGKNICGKVRRALVPGTLQVFPMRGYGAVEMGVHRFYHPGADDREPVGEARFVHLWQNKDGVWKVTRVISYNHFALPKEAGK